MVAELAVAAARSAPWRWAVSLAEENHEWHTQRAVRHDRVHRTVLALRR
jgi:hypothetical protein